MCWRIRKKARVDMNDGKTTRRRCLKALGAAAAAAALSAGAPQLSAQTNAVYGASGTDDQYDLIFTRIKHDFGAPGGAARWNTYPGADQDLLEELSKVVRCKVKELPGCNGISPDYGEDDQFNAVATLSDPESLKRRPFLFLTGEGTLQLTPAQRTNLKTAVQSGSFLLIDDCVLAPSGDFLYQSAYNELEATFGKGSVVRIPTSHEIFNNVYDLSSIGLPHCQGQNHGAYGVFQGERLAVFLSATDLHCGWADRRHSWFPNPSLGEHGYKEAIQMGINILMYAMAR